MILHDVDESFDGYVIGGRIGLCTEATICATRMLPRTDGGR